MPDLNFQVEGAEPQRFAAEPSLLFKLRITQDATGPPGLVHAIALRCQIRLEPNRRRYNDAEKERLLDLFGTPDRWGQTVRPMLWTHVSTVVPSFTGQRLFDLPVPCSYDFSLAATKYFDALEAGGEIPLCFLFSGTIFEESPEGDLRVDPISWEKEASFRLPANVWHALMDAYYPNSASITIHKDVFDRLARFKRLQGLPTWEHVLERLLDAAEAEEPVTP